MEKTANVFRATEGVSSSLLMYTRTPYLESQGCYSIAVSCFSLARLPSLSVSSSPPPPPPPPFFFSSANDLMTQFRDIFEEKSSIVFDNCTTFVEQLGDDSR